MKSIKGISLALLVVLVMPFSLAQAKNSNAPHSSVAAKVVGSHIPPIAAPHVPWALSAAVPADLVITDIQWTQVFPYSNCGTPSLSQSYPDPYVYFCVTIQNQGTASVTLQPSGANTFYFTIYRGPVGTLPLAAQMTPGAPIVIPAGGFYTLNFNSTYQGVTFPTTGLINFNAVVDSSNAIAEGTGEGNNVSPFSITITP